MSIKSVALVGASGNLGGPMLQALVSAGDFAVSVVQRASSNSVLPSSMAAKVAKVIRVPDTWAGVGATNKADPALVAALRGQDAVVVTFPLRRLEDHLVLAASAAVAGVRRYFPADWGSVDARSEQARALVPLFEKKETVRKLLEELARDHDQFSWTSIVGGHFFDWGLRQDFLHAFVRSRKANILDDGTRRSSLSTLWRYGEAVVTILRRYDGENDVDGDAATANRVLFIQSFCVSQNEVLEALQKATAEIDREAAQTQSQSQPQSKQSWAVTHITSDRFIAENKAKADAGDAEAVENLVFVLGVLDGDWTSKPDYAMDLLGLKNENLDKVVREVVREILL